MQVGGKVALMARNKSSLSLFILALVVGGLSASATGLLNTASGGYLVCVNTKSKVVTHPGTSSCPKGSKPLILGAQGAVGIDGLTGAEGLRGKDGADGKDGKTLWNGTTDPAITWGAPGDMFINSVTKTLFGPKDLTTGWPAGVSMVGPQGPQGLTGLQGPQGIGGSGPQGATGPAGINGTNGTNGTNGANGTNGTNGAAGVTGTLYQKSHSDSALSNTVKNVVTLTLPAGSYLVSYTGMAYKNAANGEYVATRLLVETPTQNLDGSHAIRIDGSVNDGRAWVARQLGITLAAPGSVSLFANTIQGAAGTMLTNGTLTAVQVASVNNQ